MFLILASFAIPAYTNIMLRAREAVLRDDLFTMRSMIDRFTLDNKRPPASLDERAVTLNRPPADCGNPLGVPLPPPEGNDQLSHKTLLSDPPESGEI